jgi:hypothetical protein
MKSEAARPEYLPKRFGGEEGCETAAHELRVEQVIRL